MCFWKNIENLREKLSLEVAHSKSPCGIRAQSIKLTRGQCDNRSIMFLTDWYSSYRSALGRYPQGRERQDFLIKNWTKISLFLLHELAKSKPTILVVVFHAPPNISKKIKASARAITFCGGHCHYQICSGIL